MKKAVCMLAALCLLAACREKPQELLLHYNQPAQFFEEALPLGNGQLGAMVYGNVTQEERISLNDITLWTGEPDRGPEHPDLQMVGLTGSGAETLQAIREALEQEDYRKAEELQLGLQGHFTESYQPGTVLENVTVYKGIPFAAPPVGDFRWKAPQPVVAWEGIKECKEFGPNPMQGNGEGCSEDCLYLNVWTPAKSPKDKLPVMVWIYGGGFAGGATSYYDGTLLSQKGVVVVSVAYRVGKLGGRPPDSRT